MALALAELHDEFAHRLDRARTCVRPVRSGAISKVLGLRFDVEGLDLPIGATVHVTEGGLDLTGEVVAVGDGSITCMPFGEVRGLRVGARVEGLDTPSSIGVGPALLGRVIDALGHPLDDRGPIPGLVDVELDGEPPHPLRRAMIDTKMSLGVRAWDTLIPAGRGQRVGIFAGSGVGKSTLLGMIARNTAADVNVVALIGERGREVREFVENDLGPEGLARSVLVIATSDAPALVRFRAAFVATRIAEYFRDQGADVMLMMDSLTRFCMAQREIGLSAGEPPTSRGYPPSVFSLLPRLLERAGAAEVGSITGLYTVLVDGDDHNDPVADAVRGILDGHIVLDRAIADQGRYPAVDLLASVSRLARQVWTPEQRGLVAKLKAMIARYEDTRDLRLMGGYHAGADSELDQAIALVPRIYEAMAQAPDAPLAEDAFRDLAGALV